MPVMQGCVLSLAGEISADTSDELLTRVVDTMVLEGPTPIVCDLSRLEARHGAPVLLFAEALARVGGWPRASLALAAAEPALAATLLAHRADRYLPVYATVQDALDAARHEVTAHVSTVDLEPEPQSPRAARQRLHDEWPAGHEGREVAAFVVHELCANALTHVGRPFTASWGVTDTRIVVAVTDESRQEPILRPVGPYAATSGRGMQLVKAMSLTWGVRWVFDNGKTVWAEVRPSAFG
jgi:hypothetical protein